MPVCSVSNVIIIASADTQLLRWRTSTREVVLWRPVVVVDSNAVARRPITVPRALDGSRPSDHFADAGSSQFELVIRELKKLPHDFSMIAVSGWRRGRCAG